MVVALLSEAGTELLATTESAAINDSLLSARYETKADDESDAVKDSETVLTPDSAVGPK
jgi:hypothetical protein